MKLISIKVMASLLVIAGCAINNIKAETIVIPDSSVKVFTVNSNEALVFTGGYLYYDSIEVNGQIRNGIFVGGETLLDGSIKGVSALKPHIYAGPMQFTLFPGVVNVRTLTNHPYKSIIHVPFLTTNTITVESNQTIRFLNDFSSIYCNHNLTTSSGTNIIETSASFIQYKEFDGPVTFTFAELCNLTNITCGTNTGPQCETTMSNFLAQVPAMVLTYEIFDRNCNPTNEFVSIDVEKSSDLNNWTQSRRFTVMTKQPYEFFRLKINPYDSCKGGASSPFLGQGFGVSNMEGGHTPPLPPPLPWQN